MLLLFGQRRQPFGSGQLAKPHAATTISSCHLWLNTFGEYGPSLMLCKNKQCFAPFITAVLKIPQHREFC